MKCFEIDHWLAVKTKVTKMLFGVDWSIWENISNLKNMLQFPIKKAFHLICLMRCFHNFLFKNYFWNVSSRLFISVLKNFLHNDVISVRRNSTLIGNSIKVIRLGFKRHHLSSSYGWLTWENFVLLLTLYHVQNRVMLKKDFIPLLKSVCLLSFEMCIAFIFYFFFFNRFKYLCLGNILNFLSNSKSFL